jgi:hypothetical protein
MVAITMIVNKTTQEIVMRGNATRKVRMSAGAEGGGRGTLSSFMSSSVISLSLLSASTSGTAVRAVWVVALALLALWIVDRMKPATPRRPIPVRVDNKLTPLYREPEQHERRKAIFNLSAGALVLGALVACIIGFMLTIALELVGGLLKA